MNKIFTIFLFFSFFFFFSCQDDNFRYLVPKNGKNCLLIKEYSYDGNNRYLLNEYSYLDTSRVAKITHYTATGEQSESRFEYNQEGKLIRFYGTFTDPVSSQLYSGYLEYTYDSQGRVAGIKGYNTENEDLVLVQHMLFFYNLQNQVYRIVSSYGSETLIYYDEKGNVIKVFFDPYVGQSHTQEEYTSYSNKLKSNSLNNILFLRDIFVNPAGSNFSQNRAQNFTIYNEDGSVKQSYAQRYYYDRYGKYIRFTSNVVGGSGEAKNQIIEAEYKCK